MINVPCYMYMYMMYAWLLNKILFSMLANMANTCITSFTFFFEYHIFDLPAFDFKTP